MADIPGRTNESHGTDEIVRLQRQVDRAAIHSQRMWGIVQLLLLRTRGVDELNRFKTQILRRHQRAHFLPGLEKLGIDRSLPPAVVAGRYHYLSNRIGGLEMEYIEESPRKVWIRYLPPCWSFTGISLAAVPSSVQRSMFAGWHPNNGPYLGAPGLRFVVTKVFQDGEPYDEGYFEDVGRPLEPDERLVCRPVVSSPEFDPEAAPRLDPAEWPAKRLALAKRKYAAGYYFDGVDTCFERYGVAETVSLIETSYRIYWTQFIADALAERPGRARDAGTLVEMLKTHCDDSAEALEVRRDGAAFVIERRNRSLAGARFPDAIHVANAGFVGALAYMLSARIRAELVDIRIEDGGVAIERWRVADVPARVY